MGFLISVFAVLVLNSLYLLELALGYIEDINDERRLGHEVEPYIWFSFATKIIFLVLNLSALLLCMSRLINRDPTFF